MPEQTIRIMCPHMNCRRVLGVPVHARGKLVRCRSCGTNIRIPRSAGGPAGQTNAAPPERDEHAADEKAA